MRNSSRLFRSHILNVNLGQTLKGDMVNCCCEEIGGCYRLRKEDIIKITFKTVKVKTIVSDRL